MYFNLLLINISKREFRKKKIYFRTKASTSGLKNDFAQVARRRGGETPSANRCVSLHAAATPPRQGFINFVQILLKSNSKFTI
jgi:hypothetical protein